MTARPIEDSSTPVATTSQLHLRRVRWPVVLMHVAKWSLVWYLFVVCLAFYPFNLVWQVGAGRLGGAIWFLVTVGIICLLVRDVRHEILSGGSD